MFKVNVLFSAPLMANLIDILQLSKMGINVDLYLGFQRNTYPDEHASSILVFSCIMTSLSHVTQGYERIILQKTGVALG
jgi:hypothetical protein